jgi:hypothetical protein
MGDARLNHTYDISGAEMERHSGQSSLVAAISASLSLANAHSKMNSQGGHPTSISSKGDGVREFYGFHQDLAHNGWFLGHLRPLLSVAAYAVVLKQLAQLLNEAILEKLLSLQFNEWGALLFHQEVEQAIDIIDAAAADVDESVRVPLLRLSWALKILTLDQPADIRRYRLPLHLIDEATVRLIMGRRVEFAANAISGVKFSDLYEVK